MQRKSRTFFPRDRPSVPTPTNRSHSGGRPSNKNDDWKRNGTPELIFGFSILGFLAVDHLLQLQQTNDRKKFLQSMKTVLRQERHALDDEKELDGSKKSLFECTIRRVPENFDGSMALKGGKLGEVVEVLEERVGPDGMYHKVRRAERMDVGWFPISCLEKNN